MTISPSAAAGLAVENHSSPVRLDRFASQDGRSQRTKPLMRKYEIAHLTSSNEIHDITRLAPALPAFEECFAAMGRGAILQTEHEPIAVEDLLPGDRVLTASSGFQTLKWKGSMTIVPGSQNADPAMAKLTRITADALGLGRPGPDLVLGPGARLVHKTAGVRTLTGCIAAFIPARDYVDSSQIIELTPIAPVHVYQLGFDAHERMIVNGVELESLHPGAIHTLGMRLEYQQLLLSLFPHKDDLGHFGGMLHPRIRLKDLDIFEPS